MCFPKLHRCISDSLVSSSVHCGSLAHFDLFTSEGSARFVHMALDAVPCRCTAAPAEATLLAVCFGGTTALRRHRCFQSAECVQSVILRDSKVVGSVCMPMGFPAGEPRKSCQLGFRILQMPDADWFQNRRLNSDIGGFCALEPELHADNCPQSGMNHR